MNSSVSPAFFPLSLVFTLFHFEVHSIVRHVSSFFLGWLADLFQRLIRHSHCLWSKQFFNSTFVSAVKSSIFVMMLMAPMTWYSGCVLGGKGCLNEGWYYTLSVFSETIIVLTLLWNLVTFGTQNLYVLLFSRATLCFCELILSLWSV